MSNRFIPVEMGDIDASVIDVILLCVLSIFKIQPFKKINPMRKIFHKVLSIFFPSSEEPETLQVVSDYRESYQRIDETLSSMPEVLQLVHADLSSLSVNNDNGRESDFTSENLFRAILVMQREGFTFRETTLRIAES